MPAALVTRLFDRTMSLKMKDTITLSELVIGHLIEVQLYLSSKK